MAPTDNYQDLALRYGLQSPPESVMRLTRLVAQQDAPLDEIARVIEMDKTLALRLLRAAYPRLPDDELADTTVDEALMRTGLGGAVLLAMGAPLGVALVKTFSTMLGLKLESKNVKTIPPLTGEHVACTIGFSGKAEGQVFLRMDLDSAARIAGNVLGLPPQDMSPIEVNDAMGELLNIITGNFKSNLCDAGLDCRLAPPRVNRTKDFKVETVLGGGLERMAFQAPQIVLFVDLTVNPWQG